jgi:transmembrane sensor
MVKDSETVRTAIAEEAGEWFVAQDEGPLAAHEAAALASWLKSSPAHVEEFLRVAAITRDLPAAADNPDFSVEALIAAARLDEAGPIAALTPAGQSAPARGPSRGRARQAALFAAAAVVGVVGMTVSFLWLARDGERLGLARTYETGHGEQATWRLPDGSVLHLDTEGSVTVHYNRAERLVSLNRGQALFEVAHDDRRRFRVGAGEAQVVAVGTQFDVYRQPQVTLVTVVEGAVSVSADEGPRGEQAERRGGAVRVTAGQEIGVQGGSVWPEPRAVDAKARVAWLEHVIIVRDQPLGELARELNRYATVTVEIADPELRVMRVSGRFDVHDTESLIALLSSLEGVSVERTTTRIRVARVPRAGSTPSGSTQR